MSDQNIVKCPECQGWGYSPLPISNSSLLCPACKGESIQLQKEDQIIFWDLPAFFDFRGHDLTKLTRRFAIVLSICSISTLLLLFIILGFQTINLL
ncbi:MAG: hypothetical protein QY330_04825 [Candidatus Dojkabacteria bacterium]|nr:MAG: hypothetical protein QY330_04825 [Candidatus Dojkabacteria bacterium]